MMKSSLLAFVLLALSRCAEAGTYQNVASLSGQGFLNAFQWQAMADPTHGRVNYVDQGTAAGDGLYSINGNTVTLRADSWSYLNPSGPGRNSFRLMSWAQYTTHVAIFDVGHMPAGCGTWPAIFGPNWPYGGEIDIVEGVNDKPPNQSTLHTGPGCTMPSGRAMNGNDVGNDCNVYDTNNAGCGVQSSDWNSYGPNFNNIGGGWYAIERSWDVVNIWFFERNGWVPSQVQYPGGSVDTSTWGTPTATFPNTDCNFGSSLGAMNIIINLTFCGDWAGNVFSQDGCPGDCNDYVNNNPGAFSQAYFEFNSLNIYQ